MNESATPTLFPDVAATLAENGYRPVPITPGKKFPWFKKWRIVASGRAEKNYQDYGAGILLGDVVGLDIDVDCPDAAIAIEGAAREILGLGDAADVPRRIGQAPRVLLPLRCSAPFEKIQTPLFRMRAAPNAPKASKVEILADRQQFVAYHVHPDTRRPVRLEGRRRPAHRAARRVARDHRGAGA